MGDLVVSLPFEAGSFDALNELFGLVSFGGESGAWKAVARGRGVAAEERHGLGKKGERRQKKKKKRGTKSAFFTAESAYFSTLT